MPYKSTAIRRFLVTSLLHEEGLSLFLCNKGLLERRGAGTSQGSVGISPLGLEPGAPTWGLAQRRSTEEVRPAPQKPFGAGRAPGPRVLHLRAGGQVECRLSTR